MTRSRQPLPLLPPPRTRNRNRAGFTLIELLVVIVVIGILVALLVPAIAGAVNSARNAQVTSEITTMSQALASFNSKYGFYPPSRIMLNEAASLEQYPVGNNSTIAADTATNWLGSPSPKLYSPATDLTIGQLAQRSVQALRKMFPKMGVPNPTNWHDFNGNGTIENGWILLEGHECLVFFLGGVPNPTATGFGMAGFSKSPTYPFLASSGVTAQSRTSPMFEFKAERLVDEDGDGIPGYLDPRNSGGDARFFAYFSAYGSNGYDPNDCNFVGRPFAAVEDIYFARLTRVNFLSLPMASFAPNPYTSTDPVSGYITNPPAGTRVPPVVYMNKESFQLISAGTNGIYGPGGQYIPDSTSEKLPVDIGLINGQALASGTITAASGSKARQIEQDNLTNFVTAKLD